MENYEYLYYEILGLWIRYFMFYVQCIFYYSLLSIDLLIIDLMLYSNNDWFLTLAISVSSQVAVLVAV